MVRVLIVDDDKLARKGLISIVPWEECGLTVVGDVSNGMIALEFLKEHEVDLVVVDLSMPVLSGLDFIRESQKDWPELQYVVLSFHESFEYVQSALRLGAVDYLSKLRLEQEDCAEVFKRVAGLLETRLNELKQAKSAAEEPGVDSVQMERLQTAWDHLYWVYDDAALEELRRKTEESGITVRQLEHLLVRTLQCLTQAFGTTGQVGLWNQVSEGMDWIGELRAEIYREAEHSTDFSQLSVCMLRAVQYIHRQLKSSHLRSDSVAEQVNMSRGYFSTNFKKIVGQTFNDFVRTARVRCAQELLKQRRMSLSELAEAVGYEDSKYFAHVFLEQTGVSCSEYCRQISASSEK